VSSTPAAIPQASERAVKDTFRTIWTRTDPRSATRLDSLSEDIAKVVLPLLPKPSGISVLEAGSGKGMISALLAERGYDVTLLDTSREALEISREVFRVRQCGFRAIQGSMFAVPVPDGFYDVIWNAGVLEHFYFHEQVEAIRELARALKPGGLLITLNPSARGWVYRVGKVVAEQRGKWMVGQEFPVRTLRKHCLTLGLSLTEERDVLAEHQFRFLGRYGYPFFALGRRSHIVRVAYLKVLGGYLKLSVIRKDQRAGHGTFVPSRRLTT
jgi:SAM-dependent methyltransferase